MKQGSSGRSRLLEAVDVRPATIDDLAAARKLLAGAFRAFASADCSEEESAAMQARLRSPDLSDALRGQALYIAWLDKIPVAMAGWQLADNNGRAARLCAVAVDPMFGFLGLGRLIVGQVETCAAKAGYKDIIVQADGASEGFFERLGYEMTARSVRSLGPATSMRVGYLRKKLARPQSRATAVAAAGEPGMAKAPAANESRSKGAGPTVISAPVLSKVSH